MRVRVKICGITRVEDALTAVTAGAHAIGLVFADSPRQVTLETARHIVSVLPPFVCAVGVFVDATKAKVLKTVDAVGLHCVQLHGKETPRFVKSMGNLSVIKAIRIKKPGDADAASSFECAIMLDSASRKAAGGTGETFPWEYARPLALRRPVILAGGLTPENVADALAAIPAWAVDVSSGVELSKGVKDANRIRAFVRNVRRASYAQHQGQ